MQKWQRLGIEFRLLILFVLTGLLALGLFWGVSSLQASSSPVSYLHVDSQAAIFIQYSAHNGSLIGSFEETQFTDASRTATIQLRFSISGTESGNFLTLNFGGAASGAGLNGIIFGSQANAKIQLDIPQSNGTLTPLTLSPSSLSAFNQAVSQINQEACTNNAAATGTIGNC